MRTCETQSIAELLLTKLDYKAEKPERLVQLAEITATLGTVIANLSVEKASAESEAELKAICNLADLHTQVGELEQAAEILTGLKSMHAAGYAGEALAEAMKMLGRYQRMLTSWANAIAAYKLALSVQTSLVKPIGQADIHNCLGITNFEKGKWDRAEEHYLMALELVEELSPGLRAKIYNNLGALFNARGEYDRAMSSYLRSIPGFQASDNQLGLAQAYNNLGMSFAEFKEWEDAAKYYEKSLEISRELDERFLTALTLLNMAELFVHTDSPAQSEEYCRKSVEIFDELGDKLGVAEASKILGVVERSRCNWADARANFEQSIAINEECSSPLGLAEAYYEFGNMCKDEGKTEEAHSLLSRSLTIFEQLKSKGAETARLEVKKLDQLYLDIIESLGNAVEKKDPYTMGHSSRVAYYSLRIAEALGLDENLIRGIIIAAYLHDVGKIYVPDDVLNKPGKLTEEEFNLIKRHPERGVASLRGVEFPWEVKEFILSHHERWDGRGYPNKLKGDEIPFGAQVISISDFFDALTTDRSYRSGWSQEKTVDIIKKNRGVLFNDKIVDCFLDLIDRGLLKAEPQSLYKITTLWQKYSPNVPAAFAS